ncbi:SDR family NAD(P)-dependent oxidoreductase [Lutibacter sp.]|uniref:SDR family NAD(P)-dependent oxidoreductase n=1 Tax=Lutibacter sp. TaxID=1925666 RepID=UPI0027353B38|nr:SDR family NAD(P)-dependent oxidoreductase [Lutibacter sp.]MDP3313946.1 SDR family NAD(P)-dependent oxidoreductase [Lutibacter sp.]
MKNQKRLEGKIALITGATGGIGEATAKRFLEEGASVMLVGRSAQKLKETRQRLANFENVVDFVADVTDEAAMAYISVRRKYIQQHREWMIRSYVLTFSFVTFRWLNELPIAINLMEKFEERGPTII